MMLSAVETRPGYKELLRELIRSQIGHLVEQLSETGEESFVVSAAGDDEVPHLIGSARGLGYMKGFTGVQEGFLHYLQKNASTRESPQASKPAERRQTLITHTESKQASTVLTCVRKPLSNPDEVTTSKPDNSEQIETVNDQSLGVIESGKQSEVPDVVQEHHKGEAAMSKLVQVENFKKEPEKVTENEKTCLTSVSEPHRSNQDVTPASKPDYSVQSANLKDQSLGLIESRKQSEGSIHSVVKEQGMVNEASPDKQAMPEELLVPEAKTFKSEKDAESVKTFAERNEVLVLDSDEEESDLDLHESDFDEMEEEEIFPQLINDLIKLKESCPEKMDTNEENYADVNNSQRNANTEDVKTNSVEGLKMESSEETGAAKLAPKPRPEIPPVNEDDRDKVKVILCGESKLIQVYQFRNHLFSLRDTIQPKDLICKFCQKSSRTIKELKEHEGTHTKMYCCFKCDKDLGSQAKLRKHNSNCQEVPQFVKEFFKANPDCSPKKTLTASKKKEKKSTTVKTMKSVIKSSPSLDLVTSENGLHFFECKDCLKKFKFRISLKKHFCKAFPKDKRNNYTVTSVDNGTSVKPQQENLPDSTAANPDNEDKHKLDASYEAAELNGDKPGKEKLDENKLSYKELLDWPILDQTCPFPNCGRKYHSDLQVKDHLVTHTNERPFKCVDCKKSFKWKRDLTRHEKLSHSRKHRQRQINVELIETASKIHAKEKPGATAKGTSLKTLKTTTQQNSNGLKSNFQSMKQEVLNKYSDARIRKYKCSYCEKRYLSSSHLEDHVVKHTGIKNFKCSVCDEKLLRRAYFRAHKKKCELQNPGRISYMVRLNRKRKERPNNAQKKQILGLGQKKSVIKGEKNVNVVKAVPKKTLRSMAEVEKVLATARECKVIENSSKVRCNVCGTELTTMKSLRKHVLGIHFIEKLYSCTCGERFHTAERRRCHIKRMGCKFVKAVIGKSSGISGGNEEKSVSNEEDHKENSFIDSGTEPASNTVQNTEPCGENDVNVAEQAGKEYLPELWPAQTSLDVPYICSICDARFSTAYDIVEHNIKEHDLSV